jgi:ABC-type multidrug transport system ATPase subunit
MRAVQLEEVSKRFGDYFALKDVSMEIEDGSSVLLVGKNGAGKSTLLRCITGIIGFEGRILTLGMDVKKLGREVRRLVGYVPQNIRYQEDVRVVELADYVADMKGVDVFLDEVLTPFGLQEVAYFKVGSLSSGMKQRLAISLALIGDPKLLILDEPFNNLDPMARNKLSELLQTMVKRGRTVIASVHTLSGLIHSFEYVAVLSDGRLVRMLEADEVSRIVKPIYKIHVRVGGSWRTYFTDDVFAKLSELVDDGYDIRDAWIEEPDAEGLLRAIGG